MTPPPSLVDDAINSVMFDVIPIHLHPEAGPLRHRHMTVFVDILKFIRKFGRTDWRLRLAN